MAKRTKMPVDLNQRAKTIVDLATADEREVEDKDPAAVERGRLGGKIRAERLTAEERSEVARNAARARWHNS